MKISKTCSLIFLLAVMWHSYAQNCPMIKTPAVLHAQDIASIKQLEENFTHYAPDVRLRPERNRLLINFAFANQQFVIDSFYTKYCSLIAESRFELDKKTQAVKLNKAQEDLYFRVPFPPPVFDSRVNISNTPSEIEPSAHFMLAAYAGPISGEPLSSTADTVNHGDSEHLNAWLKAPPYVVTEANKYFVIASSVLTYEQALQEAKRLKRRAPELDYVVYGPYGDNPYHAIMVATWLSKAEAVSALQQTKKALRMEAVIWACPNEGDYC